MNRRLYDAIAEAGSIPSIENFSGHDPIYCKIKFEKLNLELERAEFKSVPSWGKATEEEKSNFTHEVENKLDKINIPACVTHCKDVKCKEHSEELNSYCEDILEAIELSAKDQLPMTKPPGQKSCSHLTPGWNEFVKPFKEEAKFWWSVWISAGKPNDNDLFIKMKSSKAQFKYAVRRLTKSAGQIQNNAFVSSILGGSSGSIYQEVKRFRGQQKTVSSRIDDVVGSSNIADHFAGKYKDLYSKCEQGQDFQNLSHNIEDNIDEDDIEEVMKIDEDLIREAIKKMKGGKSDVLFDFSSDCLINGPKILHTHLANLFRMFLIHGKVAAILLLCSLIPIVKDNLGDLTSSDNYRAIAKSSLILKLFDWIVLLTQGEKLASDQLQFGYQRLSSTVMCTWAAASVINHFNSAGNDVFGALLDCSKAFDMVEWVTLFDILISRKVSFVFLRILLFIYSEQSCDVQWNGRFSYKFGVKNGVRQGAVSSPIFFGIYMDRLIKLLRESKLGCQIGSIYYGVMVYADDIILLCPSRLGLQAMIDICQKFAKNNNLKFSTNCNPEKSKTKCIHFSRKKIELAKISLNGDYLPWVESAKHVGNILERDNSFSKDIRTKRGSFIGRIHSILQEVHFASPLVKMKMINIYTTSFYGSPLWNLHDGSCEKLFTAWNNAIRDAFCVPRATHRYLIEDISDSEHPMVMLSRRFLKFHQTLQKSSKTSIRFLSQLSSENLRTSYGQNLKNIVDLVKVN